MIRRTALFSEQTVVDTMTRPTRSYVAHHLPEHLYDVLANELDAMGCIVKGRSRWTKRLTAGFLRAVEVGFINRQVIELFWDEGQAAAIGARKYSDSEYRARLDEAVRASGAGKRRR